jgi:hypothetical protein
MIGRTLARKLVPALLFIFALSLKFSVMAPFDLDESAALRHLPSQTMKRLIVESVHGLNFSNLASRPSSPAGFWLWNDPNSIAQPSGPGFSYSDFKASCVSPFTRPLYLFLKMLVI